MFRLIILDWITTRIGLLALMLKKTHQFSILAPVSLRPPF